ncbi:hypothetical protein E4U58_004524 [Claviceps cyperi]|nr:hypothetical protein E4U58_004524 [Claviceps cyperi]
MAKMSSAMRHRIFISSPPSSSVVRPTFIKMPSAATVYFTFAIAYYAISGSRSFLRQFDLGLQK